LRLRLRWRKYDERLKQHHPRKSRAFSATTLCTLCNPSPYLTLYPSLSSSPIPTPLLTVHACVHALWDWRCVTLLLWSSASTVGPARMSFVLLWQAMWALVIGLEWRREGVVWWDKHLVRCRVMGTCRCLFGLENEECTVPIFREGGAHITYTYYCLRKLPMVGAACFCSLMLIIIIVPLALHSLCWSAKLRGKVLCIWNI